MNNKSIKEEIEEQAEMIIDHACSDSSGSNRPYKEHCKKHAKFIVGFCEQIENKALQEILKETTFLKEKLPTKEELRIKFGKYWAEDAYVMGYDDCLKEVKKTIKKLDK